MEEVLELMVPKIAELCGKSESDINMETRLVEDLDMKSPTMVILISYLEDELEININFMQFKRNKTIREAADYVASLM